MAKMDNIRYLSPAMIVFINLGLPQTVPKNETLFQSKDNDA
jgi:hypothetical protein